MSDHRESIQRLLSAYCDAVRRLDPDAAGHLFAPDAVIRIADYPELEGRETITEGIRKTFAKFNFLHQRYDGGLIDIDGDRARARLGIFEANSRPEQEGIQIIFGTYEDEYVLLAEGWRFYRRYFSVQSMADIPAQSYQVFAPAPNRFDFSV